MSDFRVVVLNGPRQCGKTTLARALLADGDGEFLSLDDPQTLDSVLDDPIGALDSSRLVVVDEFQRGGDTLLRAIKHLVDAQPRRGQFLLTGSSRFLTVPTLSESLAGRAAITVMWPYSQGELEGRRDGFLDQLMEGPDELRARRPTSLDRMEYVRRVCIGGFPEVQSMSERGRERWFDSYVQTITQRDVVDLSRVRQASELPYLVRLLASRTGQELNVTSLAAHLMSATPNNLSRRTSPAAGPLLEQFVVLELEKQRGWSNVRVDLFHYRERSGLDVDVVIEDRAGMIAGIEVKASASVRSEDFRGLAGLRDRVGTDFVSGVVLYTGDRVTPFGDRLTAVPMSALWR